jgi:hypothetical protein
VASLASCQCQCDPESGSVLTWALPGAPQAPGSSASTARAACSMPRASGTDKARCTSPHHTPISSCVVRGMWRGLSQQASICPCSSEPVGRSFGGPRGAALRESGQSPPAQAPESPFFPQFEAGRDAREQPPPRGFCACGTKLIELLRAATQRGGSGFVRHSSWEVLL